MKYKIQNIKYKIWNIKYEMWIIIFISNMILLKMSITIFLNARLIKWLLSFYQIIACEENINKRKVSEKCNIKEQRNIKKN